MRHDEYSRIPYAQPPGHPRTIGAHCRWCVVELFGASIEPARELCSGGGTICHEQWKYRGGRPSPDEIAALRRELHVKTMIRLNRGDASADRIAARLANVNLIEIPLNPKLVGSSDPATRAGVEQAFRAFADPKNGPVYIYCDLGRDRTGFVVALYRARIQGWSFERIRTELARHGHGALMRRYLPGIMRPLAREASRKPDIGTSGQSMTAGD